MTRAMALVRRHPASWLVLVMACAIAPGVVYVLGIKGYFVMPDELTYQREALHIAETGRPTLAGDQYYSTLSQLAPLIQAPVWLIVGPIGAALDAAHILNVVVFASACIPTFLLARRITESVPASVLAGAATVAVPWFAETGTLMTEPVAYTAFCWSVLLVQRAVAEPGVRGDIAGLLGVAVAAAARSQLVVLAPALLAAVAVRELVAVRVDGWRTVVSRHWVLLGTSALLALYLIVTGKGARDLVGYYYVQTQQVFPPGTFGYGRELVTSAALACAGLTLPLAVAWILGALGRPSRPEPFAGALVFLFVGAAVVVAASAFSVRFTAGQNDRYVAYLAPLLFVGAAAALTVGPLRLPAVAIAGVATAWLYWTSTLAVQGLSLASPGSAFRTVIDGRTRVLAGHLGIADAKPTAVVAILVAVALGAVYVVSRRRAALVGVLVGAAVLLYGVAETGYTLRQLARTQQGVSPAFVASRGWADRALPAGNDLNALAGFVYDVPTTTGVWWDAVFYNRSVDHVYQMDGTPTYNQPADPVLLDRRTGELSGVPGGYLLVPAQPVHVGLRDARMVATLGVVNMVHTPPHPRAAFALEAPDGNGNIAVGDEAPLRLFGDGQARRERVALTVAGRTGAVRVTVTDARGRRMASSALAPDAGATLKLAAMVPATGSTVMRIRVDAVPGQVVKDAYAQALSVVVTS
jgi:hypothetical protein